MEAEIDYYCESNGWKKAIYIVKIPNIKIKRVYYRNLYKIGFTSDLHSRLQEDLNNLQFESIIYVQSVDIHDARVIDSIMDQVAKKYGEIRNILGNVLVETVNISKYIELINGYHYNNDFSEIN